MNKIALFNGGVRVTPWEDFVNGMRIDVLWDITFTQGRVIDERGNIVHIVCTYPFVERTAKKGDYVQVDLRHE